MRLYGQWTGFRHAAEKWQNDLEHPAMTENKSTVKKRKQHVKMICMPKMHGATWTLNLLFSPKYLWRKKQINILRHKNPKLLQIKRQFKKNVNQMQCNLVGQVLILIGYRPKRNKIVIKGQPRGMGKSELLLYHVIILRYYYTMLNFMDMITYCGYAEECPFS